MQVKYSGWMWDVSHGDEGWVLSLHNGPKEHGGRTLLLKGAEMWECTRDGKNKPVLKLGHRETHLLGVISAELGPWMPPAPRGRVR